MATVAAIDRIVHHSIILEFDLPSYGTRAAQSRQAEKLSYRQKYLTPVNYKLTCLSSAESRVREGVRPVKSIDATGLKWLTRTTGSHRRELVRSIAGVKTTTLPAYSPELKAAERVFEEVRRWVEGRVYGSIDEKVEAVNT